MIPLYTESVTLRALIKHMKEGEIPSYDPFGDDDAVALLDSLLLGIPIGLIVFGRLAENNQTVVVDGRRRIATIQAAFLSDDCPYHLSVLGMDPISYAGSARSPDDVPFSALFDPYALERWRCGPFGNQVQYRAERIRAVPISTAVMLEEGENLEVARARINRWTSLNRLSAR